ncbi:transglycosylase SLT domain-containing protein [Streptomyces sp. SID13666]|uniref:transglycosylase SLT domain-containing protein n=1 Tax=Streptomyces TaxID=1883 RepID=UPI001105AFA9|nr:MULTISPECIES: transglycosylase SLT domain-containing protein [unclassified Streptomyces]NEA54639.1 transglycosylase SLT domain-containing protein [Streptomyces sp. SID13666]NEA70428.1 transglycosylase SLT domain-containing protein [Streptomyces sp. SID13588]QNA77243.1 transglycosylase SLT domain-containing protein [Streptomyces sp. So13.3]
MGKHARKRPNRTRVAVVATASAAAVTATIACTVLPGTPEADAQNASASDAALGRDLVPANHVMAQQAGIARQNLQTAENEARARSQAQAAARSQAEGRKKAEAIRKAEGARKAEARAKAEARKRAEEAAQKRQDSAERAARSQTPKPTASAKPTAGASATPSAGNYTDDLDGWIKESLAVMAAHGIPGTYDGIYRNIIRESSGNPQAINLTDSNAAAGTPSKGLLQVIDPTFQAYHVEGTSMDIYDPVANITAACNYAAANYGSIDNVDSAY